MRYMLLMLTLLLIIIAPLFGSESPGIVVHNGENLIALTIRNETSSSIESLALSIDAATAPEWIKVSSFNVNMPSWDGEHEITLPIRINDAPEGAQATIAILLTDGEGRQWRVEVPLKVAAEIPLEYALLPNFPNPFNAETTIRYALSDNGMTILKVFSVTGQPIRTLVNKYQNAGEYAIRWDGKDNEGQAVASGVYFYRLESGNFSRARRMLLLK